MDDNQIALLIKTNPSDGLHEAIKKYRGLVCVIISKVIGDRKQDIEECIADTFVTLWKSMNEADIINLKGYIVCIARNTAIDRYRMLIKKNIISFDEIEVASDDDIILEYENNDNIHILQSLILEMDEPDREIFIRKYFFFERIREISNQLNIDEILIKNRLYRGKIKLRKLLEERNVTL